MECCSILHLELGAARNTWQTRSAGDMSSTLVIHSAPDATKRWKVGTELLPSSHSLKATQGLGKWVAFLARDCVQLPVYSSIHEIINPVVESGATLHHP
jgi:hypothetical protein